MQELNTRKWTDDLKITFNPDNINEINAKGEKPLFAVTSENGIDLENSNTDYDYKMVSAQPATGAGVVVYLEPKNVLKDALEQ